MTNPIDDLKPKKHDKEVILDLADPKVIEAIHRLCSMQRTITISLFTFLTPEPNNKLTCCVECYNNLALTCHDMSELLKEMIKDKSNAKPVHKENG